MKTTPKIGKVTSTNLVDDTTEMMVISQLCKITRIDTKTVRGAGRNTSGVKLLDLDTDDKVASATVIPPKTPKPPTAKTVHSSSSDTPEGARLQPCRNKLL